jgi:hypothetical protein
MNALWHAGRQGSEVFWMCLKGRTGVRKLIIVRRDKIV